MSSIRIGSTLSLEDASRESWDRIVLGAGVAGSSFAIDAARHGKRVLLIESQAFPREKVCGGCLNPRAQDSLVQLGVMSDLRVSGAIELNEMQVHVRHHTSRWNVPTMLSVRRSTLDSILVDHAIRAGAHFLAETRGSIAAYDDSNPIFRRVELTASNSTSARNSIVQGQTIIVATGLSRASLPKREVWERSVAHDARVGVHCLIDRSRIPKTLRSGMQSPFWFDSSCRCALHMVVGHCGYVGVCGTDGGFLDLAAAIDPAKIREHRGIGACVTSILNECQLDLGIELENETWQATPRLTQESKTLARNGVFLLGDSAGYVEPFTGEGMSWAMAGAKALATFTDGIHPGDSCRDAESQWTQWVMSHRNAKQSVSKWVARQARQVGRAKFLLTALDWIPPVRNVLVRKAMR